MRNIILVLSVLVFRPFIYLNETTTTDSFLGWIVKKRWQSVTLMESRSPDNSSYQSSTTQNKFGNLGKIFWYADVFFCFSVGSSCRFILGFIKPLFPFSSHCRFTFYGFTAKSMWHALIMENTIKLHANTVCDSYVNHIGNPYDSNFVFDTYSWWMS